MRGSGKGKSSHSASTPKIHFLSDVAPAAGESSGDGGGVLISDRDEQVASSVVGRRNRRAPPSVNDLDNEKAFPSNRGFTHSGPTLQTDLSKSDVTDDDEGEEEEGDDEDEGVDTGSDEAADAESHDDEEDDGEDEEEGENDDESGEESTDYEQDDGEGDVAGVAPVDEVFKARGEQKNNYEIPDNFAEMLKRRGVDPKGRPSSLKANLEGKGALEGRQKNLKENGPSGSSDIDAKRWTTALTRSPGVPVQRSILPYTQPLIGKPDGRASLDNPKYTEYMAQAERISQLYLAQGGEQEKADNFKRVFFARDSESFDFSNPSHFSLNFQRSEGRHTAASSNIGRSGGLANGSRPSGRIFSDVNTPLPNTMTPGVSRVMKQSLLDRFVETRLGPKKREQVLQSALLLLLPPALQHGANVLLGTVLILPRLDHHLYPLKEHLSLLYWNEARDGPKQPYTSPVSKLLSLGERARKDGDLMKGLTKDHVSLLIQLARDPDMFDFEKSAKPELKYAGVHAIRAVGSLMQGERLVPLLDFNDASYLKELPLHIATAGWRAMIPLVAYIRDNSKWVHGRVAAVGALDEIVYALGKDEPQKLYFPLKEFRGVLAHPSTPAALAGKIINSILWSSLEGQLEQELSRKTMDYWNATRFTSCAVCKRVEQCTRDEHEFLFLQTKGLDQDYWGTRCLVELPSDITTWWRKSFGGGEGGHRGMGLGEVERKFELAGKCNYCEIPVCTDCVDTCKDCGALFCKDCVIQK
eukprot:TRINITY_DN1233_c0_g1_i1.p1 TRINITY_DN1233_c0_g1~~TRINITY_DN1233_c0_g1_i1.p1  ORF type:complete len:754 (+),score=109.64 TRINITY_DN1233_c0_g1_i1:112-2373(+)